MDHVVRYRTNSGDTKTEDVATLEAAVALVERLRNEGEAEDVRVYRQVPIEFKTYYKVVVGDVAAPAPEPTAAAPSAPSTPPPGAMPLAPNPPAAPQAKPAEGLDDESEVKNRNGLFSRS